MTVAEKAAAFEELHARPGAFVIPNPWDVGTARILAGLGFEALATTSAGLAHSLGRHDGEGLVTREETLRHAAVIVDATPLPVSADLQEGFGDDPDSVARTIREAAAVGLVGGSIEDARQRPDDPIYPLPQAAERVAAAVEAARSLPFPFVLTARAENYLFGRQDLEDTIARLQAYEAAGADVLYAPGLRDIEDIRAVCAAVSKPVNVLAVGGAPDLETLAGAGVRRVSIGSGFSNAALAGFLRAAKEVREHGTFQFLDQSISSDDLGPFMIGRR
ncbi:MAG: isocitrate lyase/phosphoenolpyruvate mutase family protein [Gaiellaceae bacterium]